MTLDLSLLTFVPFVFLLTVDRGLVTVDLLAHWHIIKLAHSHCLSAVGTTQQGSVG